jgi:hypothetical protein
MSALKPYARIHALVTGAFVLAAASNLSGAVDTSTYVIQAKKTTWPVRVDGLLQEPAWRSAPVVGDFVQKEPQEGAPASERTEVRILYDDANLYIGVVCFDGDPSRIVAREMRRDIELTNEDMFEVIIDTFHDHRNAFLFAVNPLGARRDALIRDEGGSLNVDWDGIWTVRTHRDSAGWSAEIAIPFTTLRFRDSDEQNWGINFARLIARKREEIYWTPILRSYGWLGRFKTSYFGHLAGLRRLRQGTRVQAMPYVIGGGKKEDRPEPFLGTANLGLDLKLRLTSNITGDLTVNTDFAQVEADQERFNLTRFDLFFPEKREFFLEGADIFRFGERFQEHEPPSTLLFFSRTIGLSEDGREIPVLGGLKVTGKAGPYTLGLLDILTDRTSYDEDGERIDIRRANNAVVRLKRDIFAKSSVGIMVLSKDAVGGGGTDFNRAGGLDFNLAFGESIRAGGFLAKTFSPGLRGRDWGGLSQLGLRNGPPPVRPLLHGHRRELQRRDGFRPAHRHPEVALERGRQPPAGRPGPPPDLPVQQPDLYRGPRRPARVAQQHGRRLQHVPERIDPVLRRHQQPGGSGRELRDQGRRFHPGRPLPLRRARGLLRVGPNQERLPQVRARRRRIL